MGSLRLTHEPLSFHSDEEVLGFLSALAVSLGVQPDLGLPPDYFTFAQMMGGPLKARNWLSTNFGRSLLTICLADMGLLQALYACADDIDKTLPDLIAAAYQDPAHPAREDGKVWLCFGPGPDEDGDESLFGLSGMIVHETRSEELIQLVNRVITLEVS